MGNISFHLGYDFFQDNTHTLYLTSNQCINEIMDGYHNMFGEKLKARYKSPLENGDHPKLGQSDLLESGI